MKISLSTFFGVKNQKQKLFANNNKEEAIIKQGREQFKKLLEKGLSVPVVLL